MVNPTNAASAIKKEGSSNSNGSRVSLKRSLIRKGASALLAATLASSLCIVPITDAYAEDDEASVAAMVEVAPTFDGYGIVEKYLNDGYKPTLAELEAIDFQALRAWDADVAQELEALKDVLQKAEDATPTAPSDNTDEGGATGDADSAYSHEAEAADSLPTAPRPDTMSPDLASDAASFPSQGTLSPTSEYPEWSYDGDTSFVATHYTDNMNAQKLVAVIGEQAREVAQEYGVSASEMIGLAIAKSFSGTSCMAQAPMRNLFGQKAYEAIDTTEYDEFGILRSDVPRVQYDFSNELCTYETYMACLEDHAYRVANGIEESIPDDGTWGGPQGSLTNRVQAAIDDYDLTRYDQPLDFETTQPLTIQMWDEAIEDYVPAEVSLTDLVAEVTSHLGVPYVWGGTTPEGFDCSGLMQYSYANALQMGIPRTSYYQCLQGEDVDFADLHMGDLLFFTTSDGVCCHVAMYLGEGCYIEAPHQGAEVQVTMMDEKRPVFAKRLIPTKTIANQGTTT